MASGTISFTKSQSSGSYIEGKIVWESVANESANTSNVMVSIYVRKGSTTTTLTIPTEGTWKYTCTVNGKSSSSAVSKSVLTNWVLLTSFVVAGVAHEANGSKSITISGNIVAPTATSFNGHETSGSSTVSLDTISRATSFDSLTCSTNYLDGNIKVLYTPQNPIFYNQLVVYVDVNNTLTHILTEKLGQSSTSQHEDILKFDATQLTNIYSQIPHTDKAIIRVVLRTYSDYYMTKVGSDQIRDIVLTVPESVKPTVSLKIIPINTNDWLDDKQIYVAGLSSATVEFATATPGEGSYVRTKGVYWGGVEYGLGNNTRFLDIPELKKGDNIKVVGYVNDRRMRYAEDVKYVTVHSYSAPVITSMTVDRGTYVNGWTTTDTGKNVRVVFKTSLSLGNEGNVYAANFTIDNASRTPDLGTTSKLKTGTSYTVYFDNVDGDVSHDLKLTVTDSVGYTGIATITIPTTHITMEFRSNGKGIAFGKTSEEDAFECAMPAKFSGGVNIDACPVADFVIAEGTETVSETTWIYRKWYSGKCELYTYHKSTIAISTQNGGIYRSEVISLGLPFTVYDITPVVDCCDISVWASTNTFRDSNGNSTVTYVLFRGVSYTSNNWYTHIHINGRWKT